MKKIIRAIAGICVGIGITVTSIISSLGCNDNIYTVDGRFYESVKRDDGLYRVIAIVPEDPTDDYSDEIYVEFTDNDLVWGIWERSDRYEPVKDRHEFPIVINYNGEFEVLSVLNHELPEEWQ